MAKITALNALAVAPDVADLLALVDVSASETKKITFENFLSGYRNVSTGVWTFPSTLISVGTLGYGAGSGGSVTQLTSKGTAVTLNKGSGAIQTHSSSIAANSQAQFVLNNSMIGSNDTMSFSWAGGADASAYMASMLVPAAGSCVISLRNLTAGALAESITIKFNLVKGSIT